MQVADKNFAVVNRKWLSAKGKARAAKGNNPLLFGMAQLAKGNSK
jgi:hypothetical protein